MCLPVFLASCHTLLIVAGPTFLKRLWCIEEAPWFQFFLSMKCVGKFFTIFKPISTGKKTQAFRDSSVSFLLVDPFFSAARSLYSCR